MTLTRDFKQTIIERVERDPAFAKALLDEAATLFPNGEAETARLILLDYIRQRQEAAEHDAWFRRQVQIGLESANAGDLVPADEVEARFATRRATKRRLLDHRPPSPKS